MPGSYHKRKKDFSEYDSMTDEQLRQILREDAEKTEGDEEMDQERLLYIMEVLAERRKKRNEEKDPYAAWESFQKYYASEDEHSVDPDDNAVMDTKVRRSRGKGWKQGLIAAAAAIALFVGGAATAGAFRQGTLNVVAKWTQELFYFSSTDDSKPGEWGPCYDTSFDSLQAALDKYGVTQKLAPTWMPEGYETMEVYVYVTPQQRRFYGAYQNGDNLVMVNIRDYISAAPARIEQSSGLIELYESGGVEYYLFENNGKMVAAWFNDGFECSITGPISITEMKKMIDSIEKG